MISIRRLHLGEGKLYKEIRLASLKESPESFTSTLESALARTWSSWNEQADSSAAGPDRAAFIVFSSDSPIGIAALYQDSEIKDEGEILHVWISPQFRGRGVAVKLIDAIFEWAKTNRFQRVRATITKGNERALQFYRKCGFVFANESSLDPEDSVLIKQMPLGQIAGESGAPPARVSSARNRSPGPAPG